MALLIFDLIGSDRHQVPSSILRFAAHLILFLDHYKVWQFTEKGHLHLQSINQTLINIF